MIKAIARNPISRLARKLFPFLFLMIIVLAVPSRSFGLGLAVNPNEIHLENVPLGQLVAVSVLGGERMKLSIKNKGASACTFTINILPTSQTTTVLKDGYGDIPDTSWIQPENKEIRLEGNSSKAVELYLKIPKKKEYYNKKYQALIEVKSKKEHPQELFVVACQVKISFSTLNTLNLNSQEAKNAHK